MRTLLLLAALGWLVAAPVAWGSPEQEGVLTDAAVAMVEGEVVTLSDVVTETIILRWAAGGAAKDFSRETVMRDLVRRRALVAQARKLRLIASSEEIQEEVRYLAQSGGSSTVFRETMARFGLLDADIEGRARDKLLERKYLDLKRQSAFVPETRVRDHYAQRPDLYGNRPLAAVRDEIRERLAAQKSREQIDAWLDRQIAEGRIRFVSGALE